ncbi:hypothetical protein Q6247_25650, partial [Klebsiella pneumoniae]
PVIDPKADPPEVLLGFFSHGFKHSVDARTVTSIVPGRPEYNLVDAPEVYDAHGEVNACSARVELELKMLQVWHSTLLEGRQRQTAIDQETLQL